MKYILRIPMTDQYSYTEIICDTKEEYEEAKMDYSAYKSLSNSGEGLSAKEWRDTLDIYLQENKMSDIWQRMNNQEKTIINEIKKSLKRCEIKQ